MVPKAQVSQKPLAGGVLGSFAEGQSPFAERIDGISALLVPTTSMRTMTDLYRPEWEYGFQQLL
jgi:hypothetical protein